MKIGQSRDVVFAWGCDGYGRLGQGTQGRDSPKPLPVHGLQEVQLNALACGAAHCVAAVGVDSGNESLSEIYTWGKCHFGQLGHGDMDIDQHAPKLLHSLGRVEVDFIAAGTSHVLLATASGSQTYSWGCGFHGCLGHGDERHELVPREVAALRGLGVVGADGGHAHSILVLKDGSVMAMGCGDEGQIGECSRSSVPIRLDLPEPSVYVSAGGNHTLIIQTTGDLLGCGSNSEGQLGLGSDYPQIRRPTVIDLQGKRAVKAACGNFHSIVLVSEVSANAGEAFNFAWASGSNRRGQLGNATNESSSFFQPMLVDGPTSIADVSCGECHTVLVTTGSPMLLTCGCSNHGKLGNTRPKRTELNENDRQAALQDLAGLGEESYTVDQVQEMRPYERLRLNRQIECCVLWKRMRDSGTCAYTLQELLTKPSVEVEDIREAFDSCSVLRPVEGIMERMAGLVGEADWHCKILGVASGSNHTLLAIRMST